MMSLRKRKEIMEEIKFLTSEWFNFVNEVGNECAYTDNLIYLIKAKTKQLYDDVGGE